MNTGVITASVVKGQFIAGKVTNDSGLSGTLAQDAGIVGGVSSPSTISGKANSTGSLEGNLSAAYTTQVEKYEGDYDVTPKVDRQTLKTKHKYMIDDVRILAIPYFEVGNTTGGNTVYIAEKIEME